MRHSVARGTVPNQENRFTCSHPFAAAPTDECFHRERAAPCQQKHGGGSPSDHRCTHTLLVEQINIAEKQAHTLTSPKKFKSAKARAMARALPIPARMKRRVSSSREKFSHAGERVRTPNSPTKHETPNGTTHHQGTQNRDAAKK
ncbi:unnamed protein product [Ectocarpus sp. 12 AP-2014]